MTEGSDEQSVQDVSSIAIPAHLRPGFERVQPVGSLWRLVSEVAGRASLTAELDTPAYIGVRPAAHGVIAGYVNKSFVDLRLTPERAKQVADSTGWKLHATNSYTGTLRVTAAALDDSVTMSWVVDLFVEALDKSAMGPAFEGGQTPGQAQQTEHTTCPEHPWIVMLGGKCDQCE